MDAQEVSEIVMPVGDSIADPIAVPCSASEQMSKTSAVNPSQEEVHNKALAIAKRLMQQHSKTWKELAKY